MEESIWKNDHVYEYDVNVQYKTHDIHFVVCTVHDDRQLYDYIEAERLLSFFILFFFGATRARYFEDEQIFGTDQLNAYRWASVSLKGLTRGLTNAICPTLFESRKSLQRTWTRDQAAGGHCERENAPRKMQPNSRQQFLSIIQLLVSFREMLAACSAACRRRCGGFVVEWNPWKIPSPFHITRFFFDITRKLMIPSPSCNMRYTRRVWIITILIFVGCI